MPIYEYVCPNCQTEFEIMSPFSEADKSINCPKCHSEAQKRISNFASKTGSYLQPPAKPFREEDSRGDEIYGRVPSVKTGMAGMRFHPRVKSRALANQSKKNGNGSHCGSCGKLMNPLFRFEDRDIKGGWYAIPRNPRERATIENCEIICPECHLRLMQNDTT